MKSATVFKFDACKLAKEITAATHSARKTWRSAEDAIHTAKFAVRKYPFRAIGITAGVALTAGLAAGWLTARR
jgi:ElaB/YqjD/DUF883 family membrane-anchored ribosome-binding protein